MCGIRIRESASGHAGALSESKFAPRPRETIETAVDGLGSVTFVADASGEPVGCLEAQGRRALPGMALGFRRKVPARTLWAAFYSLILPPLPETGKIGRSWRRADGAR